MNKYDYKTRCRALFAITVGFIQGYDVDLDSDYFISISEFCNQKMIENPKENINIVCLLLYTKVENNRLRSYESEKTVKDLFDILDEIKTDKDLLNLYNNIKQNDIDKISDFAIEYMEYMDELNTPSTLIPQ